MVMRCQRTMLPQLSNWASISPGKLTLERYWADYIQTSVSWNTGQKLHSQPGRQLLPPRDTEPQRPHIPHSLAPGHFSLVPSKAM